MCVTTPPKILIQIPVSEQREDEDQCSDTKKSRWSFSVWFEDVFTSLEFLDQYNTIYLRCQELWVQCDSIS